MKVIQKSITIQCRHSALSLRHGLYFRSVPSSYSHVHRCFILLTFSISPSNQCKANKQTKKRANEKKFKWNKNIETLKKKKKGRFHFESLAVVSTFSFWIKTILLKYSQRKAFGTYSDFSGLFFLSFLFTSFLNESGVIYFFPTLLRLYKNKKWMKQK